MLTQVIFTDVSVKTLTCLYSFLNVKESLDEFILKTQSKGFIEADGLVINQSDVITRTPTGELSIASISTLV